MTSPRVGKAITLVIGVICVGIAAALILFLFGLLSAAGSEAGRSESLGILVSIIAPFALVFTAFGWGIFSAFLRGSSSMYSPTGWRILAGISAGIGFVCMTAAGPIALLVPGVLAIVLLIQDEWVLALVFGWGN